MDQTQERAQTSTSEPGRRLTERRRDSLRMEIAQSAMRLFADHGVAATTSRQIADAVGISTRTLWRHFPSKESCVRPLLASGLDAAVEYLRHWPHDVRLMDFLASSHASGSLPAGDRDVLELVRMVRTEPALRTVWLQAHDDALPVLADLLAERSGHSADDLRIRVHAGVLNAALRVAAEAYASNTAATDEELVEYLRIALEAAAEELPY